MFTREEIALLEDPSAFRGIPSIAEGQDVGALALNLNTTAKYAPRGPVKRCPDRWIIRSCTCGPQLVQSGCMNRDCEKCADFVKRRAGSRAETRLLAGRRYREPILKTIFTVPDYLREKFNDKKVWRATLRRLVKVLKANHGFLFGIEASHPTGDDLEVFKPHANFLWRQKKGFRAKLNLTVLREEWRKILNLGKKDKLANPHHEFIIPDDEEGKNKLSHACSYTVRPFPGWQYWTGSVRWYGKYPKGIELNQTDPCEECGDYFTYQGVATPEEIAMWNTFRTQGGGFGFHLMYPPDYFSKPKPTTRIPRRDEWKEKSYGTTNDLPRVAKSQRDLYRV